MAKGRGRAGVPVGAAKGGLPKSEADPHIGEMDDLRRMYAVMALRRPVRLSDGRTGVITRVDTDFPSQETTLHVWVEGEAGPGVAKVRAADVDELDTIGGSAHPA